MKELDQLEMILQAFEYEELEKKPGKLQEFFDSTKGTTSPHFPQFTLGHYVATSVSCVRRVLRFYKSI